MITTEWKIARSNTLPVFEFQKQKRIVDTVFLPRVSLCCARKDIRISQLQEANDLQSVEFSKLQPFISLITNSSLLSNAVVTEQNRTDTAVHVGFQFFF